MQAKSVDIFGKRSYWKAKSKPGVGDSEFEDALKTFTSSYVILSSGDDGSEDYDLTCLDILKNAQNSLIFFWLGFATKCVTINWCYHFSNKTWWNLHPTNKRTEKKKF